MFLQKLLQKIFKFVNMFGYININKDINTNLNMYKHKYKYNIIHK